MSRAVEQPFYVDNNAPAQPIAATLAGGTAWRAANSFALVMAQSGCKPPRRSPVRDTSSVPRRRRLATSKVVQRVARRREHQRADRDPRASSWCVDAAALVAGPGRKRGPVPVGRRSTACVSTMRRPARVRGAESPDDPTLFRVNASDVGSGLARTEILMRQARHGDMELRFRPRRRWRIRGAGRRRVPRRGTYELEPARRRGRQRTVDDAIGRMGAGDGRAAPANQDAAARRQGEARPSPRSAWQAADSAAC